MELIVRSHRIGLTSYYPLTGATGAAQSTAQSAARSAPLHRPLSCSVFVFEQASRGELELARILHIFIFVFLIAAANANNCIDICSGEWMDIDMFTPRSRE